MSGLDDRKYWLDTMIKIATPVLTALEKRCLKSTIIEQYQAPDEEFEKHLKQIGAKRGNNAWIEAAARTLCGIAPWIELDIYDGEEGKLRIKYAELSRKAIDAITDPSSPDYCDFSGGGIAFAQELVEGAFLAHAIVRAPNELWQKLDERVKQNLINSMKATRKIRPAKSNWLLFSAIIEAALYIMGEDCDMMRVDSAISHHQQWYKGDGIYGDGPEFHWDYYNSFVIHPMLVDVIKTLGHLYPEKVGEETSGEKLKRLILGRSRRYASILEMLISPEGTYPVIGRSSTYRFGSFQTLAQMALMHELNEDISPAQVRCALTAVIKNVMKVPGNFDDAGWLKVGVCGSQPNMGENYVSTGSLYICSVVFLPLGLLPNDEFWSGEPKKWTSQKIWSGENTYKDHHC